MILDFVKRHELLLNLTKRRFPNYFPIKVDSLDEFIEFIEREEGLSVGVELRQEVEYRVHTDTRGPKTWKFDYYNRYTAKTLTGRQIIFDELCESILGGKSLLSSVPGVEERKRIFLRRLVTADDRLTKIKERFPNLRTKVGSMDQHAYHRELLEAEKYGIMPI